MAAPELKVRTSVAQAQRLAEAKQLRTAMLTLTAPGVEVDEEKRGSLSLCAAIDVSGSMSGKRLRLAVETLDFIAGELRGTDELGIVAYDSAVRQALPLCVMDEAGKERAKRATSMLKAGSCTNLCGGLLAAVDEVVGRHSDGFDGGSYVDDDQDDSDEDSDGPQLQQQSGPAPRRLVKKAPQTNAGLLSRVKNLFSAPPVAVEEAEPQQQQQQQQQQQVCSAVPVAQPPQQQTGVPALVAGTGQPAAEARGGLKPARVRDGRIHAVLLLTDGHANEGRTTAPSILPELERHVGETGVVVHTFGFGEDHNDDLLRAISEAAQGLYYFIEKTEDIKASFANCLGGLLSVAMRGTTIGVRATSDAVSIVSVLTKYPCAAAPDGSHTVRLGDIYGEEARDTLVEVEVRPGVELAGPCEVLRWAVEYEDCATKARKAAGAATVLDFCDGECGGEVDVAVDEQCRRLQLVRVIEAANATARGGDLDGARAMLRDMRAKLQSAPSAKGAFIQALVAECDALLQTFTTREEYAAKGAKYGNMCVQRHAQQRSNMCDESEMVSYKTSAQAKMVSKSKGGPFK